MGRGRAKAKQQKVARDLKYHTQSFDADALQREFGAPDGGPGGHWEPPASSTGDDDGDDDYEDWTGTDR